MTATTISKVLPLALASSLFAVACGPTVLANGAVDENESADLHVAATLTIGGKAEVFNTGGTALNLRSGPDTAHSVVASMPDGSVVDVLAGPTGSFYEVRFGTTVGWAHMNYLRPAGTGGAYPTNIHWDAANINNYTNGRSGVAIKWIVIHDMEGSYDGSISWFKDAAAQVSAHYCIRSSDGDITQMVREQDTAWHAGVWAYNEAAIGIEHEGYMAAPARWYTEAMYERSAQLTAAIAKRYSIPIDRSHIIGHADIPPPNTHRDPGAGWDWDHYLALVNSYR